MSDQGVIWSCKRRVAFKTKYKRVLRRMNNGQWHYARLYWPAGYSKMRPHWWLLLSLPKVVINVGQFFNGSNIHSGFSNEDNTAETVKMSPKTSLIKITKMYTSTVSVWPPCTCFFVPGTCVPIIEDQTQTCLTYWQLTYCEWSAASNQCLKKGKNTIIHIIYGPW